MASNRMSSSATPNFIPTTEELGKLERDLRFHPSTTPNPKALTPDQVAAFNHNGYLAGIRIFDEEEANSIRRYFDDLLAKTLAAGGDSYSISTAHLRYGRVYDILTHPRIVAYVKDLIGDDVIAWGSHFFLQNARRWQAGFMAPGFELLAADAVHGYHGLAGDRRCERRKCLHALHSRFAPCRASHLHAERD